MNQNFNLEQIISKLLSVRTAKPGKIVNLSEHQIKTLCIKGREIFIQQPILLELEAPLKICGNSPSSGDIHGQYYDLLRLFQYGGLPPQSNYLFLGDYVDRGKQSLETICLLLAYKIKYPQNFFLLRGNHECASINRIYGFFDQCKRRYNIKLWKTFTDCFNCIPVAAIIEEKILCMHGGLSPQLVSLEQIKNIMRPTDVPDKGLLCDLLWSDPQKQVSGWSDSQRGVSYVFCPQIVKIFLQKHNLDLICRAHQVNTNDQVVQQGYQFFAKRQLVTIFSAPNYCNEFDNAGAMMTINNDMICWFQILKPSDIKIVNNKRPNTPPRSKVLTMLIERFYESNDLHIKLFLYQIIMNRNSSMLTQKSSRYRFEGSIRMKEPTHLSIICIASDTQDTKNVMPGYLGEWKIKNKHNKRKTIKKKTIINEVRAPFTQQQNNQYLDKKITIDIKQKIREMFKMMSIIKEIKMKKEEERKKAEEHTIFKIKKKNQDQKKIELQKKLLIQRGLIK